MNMQLRLIKENPKPGNWKSCSPTAQALFDLASRDITRRNREALNDYNQYQRGSTPSQNAVGAFGLRVARIAKAQKVEADDYTLHAVAYAVLNNWLHEE